MGSVDEVLSAIDAAIDAAAADLTVSRDAMRSGPGVRPGVGDRPLVGDLLIAAAQAQPDGYGDDPGAVRARAVTAAIFGSLGPPR